MPQHSSSKTLRPFSQERSTVTATAQHSTTKPHFPLSLEKRGKRGYVGLNVPPGTAPTPVRLLTINTYPWNTWEDVQRRRWSVKELHFPPLESIIRTNRAERNAKHRLSKQQQNFLSKARFHNKDAFGMGGFLTKQWSNVNDIWLFLCTDCWKAFRSFIKLELLMSNSYGVKVGRELPACGFHDSAQQEARCSFSTLPSLPPSSGSAICRAGSLLLFPCLPHFPRVSPTLPSMERVMIMPMRWFEASLIAALNAATWSSRILLVTFGPQMKSPRVINNQVKKSGKKLPSTPRLLGPHEIHIKCVNASDYDLNYIQRLLPSTRWSFFIVKLEAV